LASLLGIVAENGAAALKATADGQIQRWYRDSASTRIAHWLRLQSALADIEAQVPGARRSEDSVGRETDIAVDHSEHQRLRPQQIEAVVQRLRDHGLRVTVSSIDINAWLGEHNQCKWIGACWGLLGLAKLAAARTRRPIESVGLCGRSQHRALSTRACPRATPYLSG
jgi:hypothetical protein